MKHSLIPVLALTMLCGLSHAAAPAASARPNILFIFSDDHSLQTIGAYNTWLSEFCKQRGVTPSIDRLAAEGAMFVNSFCGNSLCCSAANSGEDVSAARC